MLELLLLGGGFEGAELFHRLLSEADGLLLDQFCAADCCCCVWLALLLASAAVLLSTSPANRSLPGDCSGFDRLGGALAYDTLVAVSDVTFCTEGLSR